MDADSSHPTLPQPQILPGGEVVCVGGGEVSQGDFSSSDLQLPPPQSDPFGKYMQCGAMVFSKEKVLDRMGS